MPAAGFCFACDFLFFKCRPSHSTTGGRIATQILALTPPMNKGLRLKQLGELRPRDVAMAINFSRARRRQFTAFIVLLAFCVGWEDRIIYRDDGGTCPQIFGQGDSHAKSSTFFTHSDAIAVFTSQSLSLPVYACTTDSSRIHENLPF